MKNRWVLIGSLAVVAVALGIWFVQSPSETGDRNPIVTEGTDLSETSPARQPDGSNRAPSQNSPSGSVSLDVANLEAALALAIERRVQAEQALDALEAEVEELEAFVDDIEARGEDPVDYADEGLARFQPAFERYEAAFAILEEAEQVEQLAREALAEAKATDR
ncbi:MAG: hypothetical protein AAF265_15260 [Pseudomonadota bacterium]